jgi:hypothetical protein
MRCISETSVEFHRIKRNYIPDDTNLQDMNFVHPGRYFFQWLFKAIQGPGLLFSSVIILYRGRTPWSSDQFVVRPLPTHRTAQIQNKRIHTPNIHALSGIRTHDRGVRMSQDIPCLRSRGHTQSYLGNVTKIPRSQTALSMKETSLKGLPLDSHKKM